MSERSDWLEQNAHLLEGKTPDEIELLLAEAGERAEADYESQKELELDE